MEFPSRPPFLLRLPHILVNVSAAKTATEKKEAALVTPSFTKTSKGPLSETTLPEVMFPWKQRYTKSGLLCFIYWGGDKDGQIDC